jgi:hypothetical protein
LFCLINVDHFHRNDDDIVPFPCRCSALAVHDEQTRCHLGEQHVLLIRRFSQWLRHTLNQQDAILLSVGGQCVGSAAQLLTAALRFGHASSVVTFASLQGLHRSLRLPSMVTGIIFRQMIFNVMRLRHWDRAWLCRVC